MSEFEGDSTMMINLKASRPGQFRLTLLGTGSAFTINDNNWQSNFLLENLVTGRRLLLDCGSDIRFSLNEHKLSAKDITDIYVSHPHADHIGGLEYVAFSTKFLPKHQRPKLIMSAKFSSDLWSKSLSGGMESIEGEVTTMSSFFDVHAVGKKGRFEWEGVNFQLVQVVHIMNGFGIVPSFGLLFKINGLMVFFTSDTQSNPNQLVRFYEMADLILHDCETTPYKSMVHAHYTDLVKLPEHIKNKMWLYHYQPNRTQEPEQDGFLGFAKKGQTFNFLSDGTWLTGSSLEGV